MRFDHEQQELFDRFVWILIASFRVESFDADHPMPTEQPVTVMLDRGPCRGVERFPVHFKNAPATFLTDDEIGFDVHMAGSGNDPRLG